MAVKETLQPPLHGLLDNPGALASMVERTGPTPRASSPRRTCGTSRRSAGKRRSCGSRPPTGCGRAATAVPAVRADRRLCAQLRVHSGPEPGAPGPAEYPPHLLPLPVEQENLSGQPGPDRLLPPVLCRNGRRGKPGRGAGAKAPAAQASCMGSAMRRVKMPSSAEKLHRPRLCLTMPWMLRQPRPWPGCAETGSPF